MIDPLNTVLSRKLRPPLVPLIEHSSTRRIGHPHRSEAHCQGTRDGPHLYLLYHRIVRDAIDDTSLWVGLAGNPDTITLGRDGSQPTRQLDLSSHDYSQSVPTRGRSRENAARGRHGHLGARGWSAGVPTRRATGRPQQGRQDAQ
jgi:hypothetical protein